MPSYVGPNLSEAYAYCQILKQTNPEIVQASRNPISITKDLLKEAKDTQPTNTRQNRTKSPSRNSVKGEDVPCANRITEDKFLLQDPTTDLKEKVFCEALAKFCLRADIKRCLKCSTNNNVPKCDTWPEFREWAAVCMLCKAFHSFDISKASIHIASAISGCCFILKKYLAKDDLRSNEVPGLDINLHEVTNVIYWMATSMAERGAGPNMSWDQKTIPSWITIPATQLALAKANEAHLCKNRLWNLVKLSDRKHCDIPDFINTIEGLGDDEVKQAFRQDTHDLCSPTKCQEAHRNTTNVKQLHKCGKLYDESLDGVADSPGAKTCGIVEFKMQELEEAVKNGKSTAWHTWENRLCIEEEAYMAVSHVWADGTGVGGGRSAGTVNKCLFEKFARSAEDHGCVGLWWDTISVPERNPARGRALQKMHSYYSQAKHTVVHDAYLLQIPWKEDGSPCIALVLSPWFTRGWTALELLVSKSIKVMFKDNEIKDLKSDILAKDPASSTRGHWMATRMIQRLIRPVKDFGDLLAILSPRYTSWMRDRTMIAALLVNLPDFDPDEAERTTIERMISHLGKISHVHLLHGKSTATTTGSFSWLPSTLDDIPVDFPGDLAGVTNSSALLNVSTEGVVEGFWFCKCVEKSDVDRNRVKPWGFDLAVEFKVDAALLEWENCLLLSPTKEFQDRVLLAYSCGIGEALKCQYIASIASHDSWEADKTCEERFVRIGGEAGQRMSAREAVMRTTKPHLDQQTNLSLHLQKHLGKQRQIRQPQNHGRLKVEYQRSTPKSKHKETELPRPSIDDLQKALEDNNCKAVAWILKMDNFTSNSKRVRREDPYIMDRDDVVRELLQLKPVSTNKKYLEDLLNIYTAIDPTQIGNCNLLPSLQFLYLSEIHRSDSKVVDRASRLQGIWEQVMKRGQSYSSSDSWCLLKYNVLGIMILDLLDNGDEDAASKSFWEGLQQFCLPKQKGALDKLKLDKDFPWNWKDTKDANRDGDLEMILRAALKKFVMIYRGERPAIIPITSLSLGIILSRRLQEEKLKEQEELFRTVLDDFKTLGLKEGLLDMISRYCWVKVQPQGVPKILGDELLEIRTMKYGKLRPRVSKLKEDAKASQYKLGLIE